MDKQTLGPYQIYEQIGIGGMGKVYKGYDPHLERTVAIKVILNEHLATNIHKRFLEEVKLTARLKHPNIVTIYNVGTDDNTDYMVMDFIEGETLADVLAKELPVPRRSLEIIKDIALAIAYAHHNNIVHRDLKPGNIMIEKNRNTPLVMDFGLAKNLICEANITQSGEVMGTPQYMAPEQAKAKETSAATDVYALGVILYEMLTGTVPFDGQTPAMVMYNVVHREPLLLRKHNKKLALELEAICCKAMHKKPAKRYANAKEFSNDIENFLNGRLISANPITLKARLKNNFKRHRMAWIVFSIFLILIILTLFLNQVQREKQQQKKATKIFRQAQKMLFSKTVENYILAAGFCEKAMEIAPKKKAIATTMFQTYQKIALLALDEKNYLLVRGICNKLKRHKQKKIVKEILFLLQQKQNKRKILELKRLKKIVDTISKQTQKAEFDWYLAKITSMSGTHIVKQLIQLIKSPVLEKRLMAINALGKIGNIYTMVENKDSVEWLLVHLKELDLKKDLVEIEATIWALGWLGHSNANDLINEIRWKAGGVGSFLWERTKIPFRWIPIGSKKPKNSRQWRIRGRMRYDKGDIKGAVADCTQAIALDPKDARAYCFRANAYVEQKKIAKAIADYSQSIMLNTRLEMAYCNLAALFYKQKKYPQAIANYTLAIAINPKLEVAHANRGAIFYLMGKNKEAIANYKQAIKINPLSINSYVNRGLAYFREAKLKKALEDCNKAIEINPRMANSYKIRADIHKKKGNIEAAILDYTQTIKLNPRYSRAYFLRAALKKQQKNFKEAIGDYTQLIRLSPKSYLAYNNRGHSYQQMGNFYRAIADYNQAIAIAPQKSRAYINRAICYERLQKWPYVVRDFSKTIEISANYRAAYLSRGQAYLRLNKVKKAIEDYNQAIKLKADVQVYIFRGQAYLQLGNIKKALQDYNRANQINPKNAAVYLYRGVLLRKLKKHQFAIADFRKYLRLNPNSPQKEQILRYIAR